jgi:hypothetical protein
MEFLEALSGWPPAVALRGSLWLYPLVNAAHIFSIGLILGSIVTLDLRVLGLFRTAPLAALSPPLTRMAMTGVFLAALTGFLLFTVRPQAYAANPAFLIKLGLVALGILNALVFHTGKSWRMAVEAGTAPSSIKLAALFSVLIWAAAVLAGRWIGFVDPAQ